MAWAPMAVMAALSAYQMMNDSGKEAKEGSTYTGSQQGLIDKITKLAQGQNGMSADVTQNPNYQQGQDYLQGLYNDPEFFNKFEAPIQRQYEEEVIPGLANRFASQGSGGSLGSTGFRNQLTREGSNLSSNIANLRGGMQMQGLPQLMNYAQQPFNNLMSMYNTALNPQPNNQYFPSTAGAGGQIASSFAGGLANAGGQYAGNELMKSWNSGSQTQLQPGQNPLTG